MTTAEPLVMSVDDEAGILRLIDAELSSQGFRVISASNGEDALRIAEEQRPDIAVLDIMMPGISGLEVMRKLRERSTMPIILVSAKNSNLDKVRGLELGADDYISKPFDPEELSARIRAVLRRSVTDGVKAASIVRAGNVEVDLERRLVRKNGQLVKLTRTEWMLLQHLAANAGKVMVSNQLLSKVWGPEYREELQYLRVWVFRLRSKLEDDPANPVIIKTLTGIGYIFCSDEFEAESESAEG
ncbi:MAG TPA: response regulator transcription factor [Dehalococcoidia bacterium]|nr:response regulator transcription factor [Dehalococcoidia bacterium]